MKAPPYIPIHQLVAHVVFSHDGDGPALLPLLYVGQGADPGDQGGQERAGGQAGGPGGAKEAGHTGYHACAAQLGRSGNMRSRRRHMDCRGAEADSSTDAR